MSNLVDQPQLFNTDPYETVTDREISNYQELQSSIGFWGRPSNTNNWFHNPTSYTERFGHEFTCYLDQAPFSSKDMVDHLQMQGVNCKHIDDNNGVIIDLRFNLNIGVVAEVTAFVESKLPFGIKGQLINEF